MWIKAFIFQSRLLTTLAICFLTAACASPEATWKTVPETNMPYERAWAITVNSVAQHFDLESSDAQSGYLRTSWKVTNSFLGIPNRKARALVRVEERKPFRLKVKVEKQEPNPWDDTQWRVTGDDDQMASEILEELSGRLRSAK